jgi:hypothetical protein
MWLLLVVANFVFLKHLAIMVLNRGRKAGQPTLIHEPPMPSDAELTIPTEGVQA